MTQSEAHCEEGLFRRLRSEKCCINAQYFG